MLIHRTLVGLGFIGCVVTAVACSGGIDGACGSYFDETEALATQCGTIGLDPSARASFLEVCDALAKAPGTSNLADEINACSNAISSSSCDSAASVTACSFRGTLANGTPCGTSTQCSGGVCDTSGTMANPASELQCGVCASFVAIGGDCSMGGSCDDTTSSCVNGKCAAYVGQGGTCGGTGGDCTPGLACNAMSSTCQPLPTKGQACTFECAAPERCVSSVCADPVQQGGACPTGLECASNLECDGTTKTCQPPTTAQVGQACGLVNNMAVLCAEGLNCTNAVCVAPKTAGQACTVGMNQCAIFLTCINGTCAVPDYTVCK